MSQPEIFVVDDDRGIRETLGDVLRDEGYRVRLARDGDEALALLRASESPQLILLDLSMPGMSGLEFRRAQLEDVRLAEIPVVVLSADERNPLPDVAGWLRKPVELDALLSAVRDYQLREERTRADR